VQRVALSLARSCTVAHNRHASLHLGVSRAALLAAASRPLAVQLREERRAWFSSKLNVGPQPPRVTQPRSVAPCGARRCVAAFGRPAACIASRLVQLEAARRPAGASRLSTSERRALRSSPLRRGLRPSRYLQAARRPTAASRHSTSERRVLRSSPLRCGPWPSRCVQSVAPGLAQSCTAAHSRLASLHLGASRVAQLAATRRPWPSRCGHGVALGSAQSCTAAHSRLASLHLGASRVAQLAATPRPLAVPLRAWRSTWLSPKLHGGPQPPAWRSTWLSPKLHGGPQPPHITPPRSVACSTARRCAAALGRLTAGIA